VLFSLRIVRNILLTREFPVFGVANYCALMLDELKKLEPRKDLLSQRDFFAPLKNEPEEKEVYVCDIGLTFLAGRSSFGRQKPHWREREAGAY